MNLSRALSLLCAVASLAFAPSALAGKVTVPVDIGVGPAFHMFTGPIQQDQTFHYGLVLSVRAIIDHKLIKDNQKKIPRKYRKMALGIDELRYSPSILIPDTILISPKLENTSIYGLSFRPIGIDPALIKKPFRLTAGLGLRLTYGRISSDGIEGANEGEAFAMNWFRPGIDGMGELEIPFSERFLISGGWDSQLYLPQTIGGPVFAWGEQDERILHVGQAFMKLHIRFPYTTRI